MGFRVKAVKNGFEAIAELQEHRPDLIVTDLILPVVDGLNLIKIVKSKSELADIPVIAVTSYGGELEELAISAGADKVIKKSVECSPVCDLISGVFATYSPSS